MKNEIFDMQRYLKYQKHIVMDAWWILAGAYGFLIVVSIIIAILGTQVHIPPMIAFLIAIGSNTCGWWQMFVKNKCLYEMMIPASNLEKYVSRLTIFGILPWIVSLIVCMVFDFMPHTDLLGLIVMGSTWWLLGIVIKRYAIFLGGCMVWVGKLFDIVNDDLCLVASAWIIACVVLGYVFAKRMKLTLDNWNMQ